jgi:hypothetical protein
MKRLIYGMLALVLLLSVGSALPAEELEILLADGGICPALETPEPVQAALVLECWQCRVCSSNFDCGGTTQGYCLPTGQAACPQTSTGKACYCR